MSLSPINPSSDISVNIFRKDQILRRSACLKQINHYHSQNKQASKWKQNYKDLEQRFSVLSAIHCAVATDTDILQVGIYTIVSSIYQK
jgi:hypothetical protein